jgi:hypothetical protein
MSLALNWKVGKIGPYVRNWKQIEANFWRIPDAAIPGIRQQIQICGCLLT